MILIGMGANLPALQAGGELSPKATLEAALAIMPAFGIAPRRRSSWYRTPAMAPHEQPPYVNAVAIIETALSPSALLAALHRIEALFGRVRRQRWGARTLDLDILDYDGLVIPPAGPRGVEAGTGPLPLALPHPGIAERGFVLVPLAEVAPAWRHPVSGEGAARLLERLCRAQGPAATAEILRLEG